MTPIGLSGIIADYLFLQGLKTNDLYYFRLAKTLFPFEREILIAEAQTYIKFKIINEKSLASVDEALKYDPYSASLLSISIQYNAAIGDKNKAVINFYKLQRISPNAPIIQELIKRGAR